ncbi:MAG: hypothetical protein KBA53_06355 [Thermoclostridium sp.]|nr:hypothetical protein [Thermoclostridium sp.]
MEFQCAIHILEKLDIAKITEKELREALAVSDYAEYCNIVMTLVQSNILAPVKSSGLNGMRPPLFKRYTLPKPKKNYEALIPEIRLLHNKLNIEGYLANPERYVTHQPWISCLDSFLKTKGRCLDTPLSVNERSFQIFQKEKALKMDRELSAILSFNPGIRELLNTYNTPEPFHIYTIIPSQTEKVERNVLIIENKDTWYTLRSRLSPTHNRIGGIPFHSLIYGEGKKISRKIDSLTEFDSTFFNGEKTKYYYFGDLDYEGLSILQDLMQTNPALNIQVMKPLYIAMLKASVQIQLPVSKEKQNKKAAEWFLSLFEAEQRKTITQILESGTYIPQEILNNEYFLGMIMGAKGDLNV